MNKHNTITKQNCSTYDVVRWVSMLRIDNHHLLKIVRNRILFHINPLADRQNDEELTKLKFIENFDAI